jgi:hypothetical protein
MAYHPINERTDMKDCIQNVKLYRNGLAEYNKKWYRLSRGKMGGMADKEKTALEHYIDTSGDLPEGYVDKRKVIKSFEDNTKFDGKTLLLYGDFALSKSDGDSHLWTFSMYYLQPVRAAAPSSRDKWWQVSALKNITRDTLKSAWKIQEGVARKLAIRKFLGVAYDITLSQVYMLPASNFDEEIYGPPALDCCMRVALGSISTIEALFKELDTVYSLSFATSLVQPSSDALELFLDLLWRYGFLTSKEDS